MKLFESLHSILSFDFAESYMSSISHIEEAIAETSNRRRYLFDRPKEEFMNNDTWRQAVIEIVDIIIENINNQREMDLLYDKLCKNILKEMDNNLKFKDGSQRLRKRFRNSKPYWDDSLTELWTAMHNAEKEFLRCVGVRREKQNKLEKFKDTRNKFDKLLVKKERAYRRGLVLQIEEVNTKNPRDFWNHINKLGPRSKKEIPMKVEINGQYTTNREQVLGKWKHDFEALYNQSDNAHFDNEFYNSILIDKQGLEEQASVPDRLNEQDMIYMNEPISMNEVMRVIQNVKMKKAVGFDSIPNEVIKNNRDVISILHMFFNHCFTLGIVPDIWNKAIISPIPKGADKNPYLPLSYRGISLLSCIFILHTGILNNRIVEFTDDFDIMSEEQNGFRKGRSCREHIFVLTSIIRNRMAVNQDTYACFIDLQKAFDWVDRDLLMWKLMHNNIGGKLYKAIKSLYARTLSCIRLNDTYTDWFHTKCGVRQGDTLSPTLFNLYINDFIDELNATELGIKIEGRNVGGLLYADDIVLLAENAEQLQRSLCLFQNWCNKWRLKVNLGKTKVIHFRKKGNKITDFQFKFHDHSIEKVQKCEYLGLYLVENLNLTQLQISYQRLEDELWGL